MQLVTHVRDDHPGKLALESAVKDVLDEISVPENDTRIVLGDEGPFGAQNDDGRERVRIAVLTPTSVRFGVIHPGSDRSTIAEVIRRLVRSR